MFSNAHICATIQTKQMKAKSITLTENGHTVDNPSSSLTQSDVKKKFTTHHLKTARFTAAVGVFSTLIYCSRTQGDLFLNELVISGIIVTCLFLLND